MAMRDTDVEIRGDSLADKKILLGVSGGIAAVDTVRLARELRRHGANVIVMMTHSAQKIISPLAVEWATQTEVITNWESDLSALETVDGILIAPATRDLLASYLHGLQHGPILMALSAARTRKCPVMMIPSMHADLADDPVTNDLVEEVEKLGIKVHWGEEQEGKRKTPPHDEIVARFANYINMNVAERKSIVITLGSTRSPIDDIRYVQNTSSGKTGFEIADHLFRHGHDVTCVAGITSFPQPKWLPLVIKTDTPNEMLRELKALSNDKIDAWIHSAAVLDYVVDSPAEGKLASQQGPLQITLVESEKHILELKDKCQNAVRIGFKLETGIKQKELVRRAVAQLEYAEMTAVIANRLEDLKDKSKPRAYLVDKSGADFTLNNMQDVCIAITTIVERGNQ
ncbi:MAG TPA: bifunctional phosphopantothenoylcysteine decarboxylase/phosphopantothenate--cysteine ligase CoaBC [Candidatus Poseidoniaceae archaeon]|nr:MAG TPA: bifunctional phosphopantothenoylcysteine decarboxylase/phosphopantothenate--cysteine ligase CoaBC [Candidatus Poseidoniales archaeon]DAC58901.1 MAG TPA: bifunctional phosphopantothenoylcysteine decarboxylase/phosphopantothenate--cysteine ligase CoaBC [Candidatus Poseidoniales archaeon]HII23417.1 bifunctional phosphopantothenoylcysteine decarboxylase/phosphopantothenate--cysteine ligase CoaBC [Candidatus Poseidoniaceae archaeon]HII50668.1 bifunctional phosphopantothenoylcysteine decar|tara:strand:+ start:2895 stop:4094 length:1200 start_codon:yes stop_codon:yes gene_type:complete